MIIRILSCLCTETYSAHQEVEHDARNLMCLGGRVLGPKLLWELVQTFLQSHYHPKERFQRRLYKGIALEQQKEQHQ